MKETLMPRRRARAFAAGVALVLLATLAACGDDPSDEGEPAGGGTTAAASQDEEGAATTAAESAASTQAPATTEGAATSAAASGTPGGTSTTTAAGPPATTGEVEVADFTFIPEEIEITAGGEVIWFNRDDFAHQIVATDSEHPFAGDGTIQTDETYSVTFAEAGTYDYFCGIHNSMTGSIVVT
jgi:plastocyanin